MRPVIDGFIKIDHRGVFLIKNRELLALVEKRGYLRFKDRGDWLAERLAIQAFRDDFLKRILANPPSDGET